MLYIRHSLNAFKIIIAVKTILVKTIVCNYKVALLNRFSNLRG